MMVQCLSCLEEKKHYGRGLCVRCYSSAVRRKTLDQFPVTKKRKTGNGQVGQQDIVDPPENKTRCLECGCEQIHCRLLCKRCYQHKLYFGLLEPHQAYKNKVWEAERELALYLKDMAVRLSWGRPRSEAGA